MLYPKQAIWEIGPNLFRRCHIYSIMKVKFLPKTSIETQVKITSWMYMMDLHYLIFLIRSFMIVIQ